MNFYTYPIAKYNPSQPTWPERIISACAKASDLRKSHITRARVRGDRHHSNLYRRIAMWCMSRFCSLTYSEIGVYFGCDWRCVSDDIRELKAHLKSPSRWTAKEAIRNVENILMP